MNIITASIVVALTLVAAAALADIGPDNGNRETRTLVGPCTACEAAWGSHD